MCILRNPLFFLPIHRRSYDKYYKDHNKWVEPKKREVEEQWGKSFGQLKLETRVQWEEMWFWPPWKFNDIVGYLDIGMDGGNCLTADVYLKRKHFSRSAREKTQGILTTNSKNQFIYYREISKIQIDVRNNNSYIQSLNTILKSAAKTIKRRNQSFTLWLPPFNFNCFNFVEAYKQSLAGNSGDAIPNS